MRSGALNAARFALLAGPVALAFFAGGYFDVPRVWAGLGAWALVAAGAALAAPLPRGRAAGLAVGGLLALAAWTLLSTAWAAIAGDAYHAGQRVFLYAGGLLAAAMLLRDRRAQRAVEPAVAAGALIVVGYGLSERFLPGLLHFSRSVSAQGRLEQPLTYWNAMGLVAAIGLVLCARLAGDATRAAPMRIAAAAAAAPLGMGLYVSFSRGALFACVAGFVALIAAAPRREQLNGAAVTVVAAGLSAAVAAPLHGVTSLAGSASTRERQGAIALALLALIVVAAAAAQRVVAARERPAALSLPRHAPAIAALVVCAGLGLAIAIGSKEHSAQALATGASRLETLQSNRYAYWKVALRAFAHDPVQGVGAGNWVVWWLRHRPFSEGAQDAHSLELQTMAELGLVGLALLAVFLAGIALAARAAHRFDWTLAAGPLAGFVVYLAHSPLDWDWQLPAATLPALVLAGALLGQSSSATRGASRENTQTASTQIAT
jgi:hypothetical protein